MPTPRDSQKEFEQRFIAEFLKDYKGAAAARRAGDATKAPHTTAYRLLQKPEIREAIKAAERERMGRVKVEADDVLREVLAIAMADTNEIVEIRRGCCRHCHGLDHKRQYTDERELRRAQAEHELSVEGMVDAFEHGGLGFDPKLEPHEGCPQCGGEGTGYVHVKDTRMLSPGARALFAGAKQTKDGIEVKLHDKSKHVELLMRHLGLLNDKLELKGDLVERITRARKRG